MFKSGMVFRDRIDAGRTLADALAQTDIRKPVVFGIPRGGVIVGLEVARRIGGLLDVIVPAKIRAPGQPELGLGAVAPDGSLYLDDQTMEMVKVSDEYLEKEIAERRAEIERRTAAYRGDREPPDVSGRSAVLVDDGIATGGTAIAAARALRNMNPGEVVLAVPVAPRSSLGKLDPEVDRIVCLQTPEPFVAVGAWYEDFSQVTDKQVREAMDQGAAS